MSPASTNPQTVLVDTIAVLSDYLSSADTLDSFIPLLTLAYQVKTPPPSQEERLSTLMRVLSAPNPANTTSKVPSNSHSRAELIGSFIHFLSPVLNGMAGLQDFEAAVGALSNGEDFRGFWDLDGSNLIREAAEGSERAKTGGDIPFLEAFVADTSCRVGYGAARGGLFLLPADAEIGDEVWSIAEEESLGRVVRAGKDVGRAYVG